jgi:O-methyltransferase
MSRQLPRLRAALRPVVYGALSALNKAKVRMNFPPYSQAIQRAIDLSGDPVRYTTVALALKRIQNENIAGAFAEVGVWKGATSEFIHLVAPERRLYLFDTFQGFPDSVDKRFRDTSVEFVRQRLNHQPESIIFRVGRFPETARGLEDERFAFVMYDADTHQAALDALEFFYPRLSPRGYFFLHDFNSEESDWGVSRAVSTFLGDKPERVIELADPSGTAVFRKV